MTSASPFWLMPAPEKAFAMNCSSSMSVPFLSAVGVVRDAKCTGAGTGAFLAAARAVAFLMLAFLPAACLAQPIYGLGFFIPALFVGPDVEPLRGAGLVCAVVVVGHFLSFHKGNLFARRAGVSVFRRAV